MKINWLLSILPAITLSIIANLLTPYIRNWFIHQSSKKTDIRIDEIKKELKFVTEMVESETELLRYALWSLLNVLLYITIASIIAIIGTLFSTIVHIAFKMGAPVIALFGTVSATMYWRALTRANESSKIIKQVRHFEEYKLGIKARLQKLKNTKNNENI